MEFIEFMAKLLRGTGNQSGLYFSPVRIASAWGYDNPTKIQTRHPGPNGELFLIIKPVKPCQQGRGLQSIKNPASEQPPTILVSLDPSGGARRGSKRSPLLVGGGKTFGPSPRDYTLKMNRKQKLLAKKSAFSDKAIGDGVFVFDNFKFDVPKTTKFLNVLKGMEVLGKKVLVLVDSYSYIDDDSKYDNTVNILKSARNIKNVRCQVADTVTTYEIVNADYIAVQKDALITIDRVNA